MGYTKPKPTVIALKVIPKPAESTRSVLQLELDVKGSVIINVTEDENQCNSYNDLP